MESPLLSGFGKRGVELGLLTKPADILDSSFLSTFFVFQEFQPKLTAGKNSITFNGSELLKQGSEVLVECIDSSGESLYIESTVKTSVSYKEASTYILSIHIYNEVSNGPGKLILYGTAKDGFTVKWIGNIVIDKTLQNISTVRFYTKPTLQVDPILSPVLSNVGDLTQFVSLTGSFYGYAVKPEKDTVSINKKNVDIDYRIFFKNLSSNTNPTGTFNSQLIGFPITLNIRSIQEPYSYRNINVDVTSSFNIKQVLNSSTVILNNVITYPDTKKNDVVVNVIDGDFLVDYPYVVYNTASESSGYLVSNTAKGHNFVKQSYANIIYRNLRTFSGFIARHKVYKKSLFSPGDFAVIADEPLISYELLQDKLTTNKSFSLLGSFYNQEHVNRYWFVSGNRLQLTQSSDRIVDSVNIECPGYSYNTLTTGSVDYIILKDNASDIDRNSTYYAYDPVEFAATSGSSYDSNFIELKKDVNYILSLTAILKKDSSTISDLDAGLEVYFTSSLSVINLEQNSSGNQNGLLKLGVISAFNSNLEKIYTPYNTLFSVSNDLYGTIVIVPKKCAATISNLSLKPFGDYGFSPDTLVTKIPFPVTIANETFEIKSELFDINSNLVYSDLRTVTSFDPSGSSLAVFIPGYKDPSDTTFISGSLEISQSLTVGENTLLKGSLTIQGSIKFENIEESSYTTERMLSWHPTSRLVSYTNVNNILPDNDTGTEEIDMTLYAKNSDVKTTYRLIPSVKGRNIFVPKKSIGNLPPSIL